MNNPFDNFDFSLRAINGLKVAGFNDMNDLMAFLGDQDYKSLANRLAATRKISTKTISEILVVLGEQYFIAYPEPKEPELEYPQ